MSKNEMSPAKVGALSELVACTWLMREGYDVFRNVSPVGKIDLIAEKDGRLIKIDVKTADKRDGSVNRGGIKRIDIAHQNGIALLFVMPDGSCKWDWEFPKQRKANRPKRLEDLKIVEMAKTHITNHAA